MPEIPPASRVPSGDSDPQSTTTQSQDLEQLLDLTASAAARYVDYLLVHEQSFRLIQQLTEFHTAICQARETLQQNSDLDSIIIPAGEATTTPSNPTDVQDGSKTEKTSEVDGSREDGNATETTLEVDRSQEDGSATETALEVDGSQDESTTEKNSEEAEVDDFEKETTVSELAELREVEEEKEFLEGDYVLARGGIRKLLKELMIVQTKAEPKIDDIEHLSLLDLEVEEMPACKSEKEMTDSKTDSEEFLVPLVKLVEKLEAVVHDLLPRIKPRPQKSNPEEDGDKVISDDETAKEEEVCTCHLNSKEDDKSSSKPDETTEANKNKEPVELATYVRQMLEMNTSLKAKVAECPSLADEIVNTIVSKSENIEAVADIHLMRVASTLTPQGAKEVLKALPSGSRDTYALAIRAIESQSAPDRDLAKRVLIWLTHPMRQLTGSELQHALFPELVNESDSSQLDNCTTEIRRVCYGLIILDPEEDMNATFAHPTVKQYLLDDCKAFFSDIHYSMALDCIRYLMLPAINKGCTQALSNRLDSKKFLGYASFHWAKHSRRVTPENSAMMKKAIIKFLGRTGSVSSVIQVVQGAMWPNSWATSLRVMSHFRSQAKKRILATAFFKLNDLAIAEVQVRASKVTNIKDNQGQSLLSIAAMMDNLPLVKVLLAKSDIEADAKDNADRTPLLWAAASGARVEILKLLLDRPDVNPDPKNTIGQTALSWAASGGHTHAVEILLAKGPEVDSNNKEISGATPLSLAAKGGHVDVVRKLINHPGIDLEMKTGYGRTALGWAAVNGHSEIVRLLLEKGATWDTTDESGSTPLTLAAKAGFLDTVKLLLEQDGINADVTEQDGATPLSLAAQGGHTEIAKLLLTRSDVNPDSKDSFNRTPLKWACREESVEIARMLLEIEKVDPNSRDIAWGGYTPLHSAADRGNFEIVKLLLERPDIQADLPDDRANTPLLEAIWRGNTNIVELLLSRKDVDPDKKGDGERTPLMLAASRGWVEIFKVLLSRAPKEVDINAVDNSRQNALYHASFHGFSDMVALLLAQEGVEVNTLDNVGDTALGIAVEYCYPEVVKLFLAREDVDPDLPYGRSLRTPLGWAAYVGNHEIINLLLDTGRVNVNHQDAEGGSPLLLGIRNIGDDEIRNRLLECEGIDVTLRDNEGRTALSYAAQMGCVEAVQTLVDPSKPWAGKVDLDERDNFQRTPLWWAANSYRKGVVEYLLGTGKVTLDAQDNHGTTPLCIAAWHGCVDIVELLLACEDVNPGIKDNDGDTVLLCAAGAGRDDIVKILLEHPLADPEEKNNAGRTALACAANAGYVEVLPLLLEYRGPHPQISPDIRYVDPDSRTNDGQTPLSLAAGLGRLDVVEYLLALDDGKAVNPNSKCDAGRTPLSYAAENARFEVVKLLIERDDVNYYIKDNEGHTPRWWSKQLFGGGQSSVAVVGLFNRYKPGHP